MLLTLPPSYKDSRPPKNIFRVNFEIWIGCCVTEHLNICQLYDKSWIYYNSLMLFQIPVSLREFLFQLHCLCHDIHLSSTNCKNKICSNFLYNIWNKQLLSQLEISEGHCKCYSKREPGCQLRGGHQPHTPRLGTMPPKQLVGSIPKQLAWKRWS